MPTAKPLYLEIADKITEDIRSGALVPGTELPSTSWRDAVEATGRPAGDGRPLVGAELGDQFVDGRDPPTVRTGEQAHGPVRAEHQPLRPERFDDNVDVRAQ
jgi:hypothetical protein